MSLIAMLILVGNVHAAEPVETETLAAEMHQHWRVVEQARQSLLQGDVGGAAAMGRELAKDGSPRGLPSELRPLYAELKAAAKDLSKANELEGASLALGRLGLTCAECHSFTGEGPRNAQIPTPSAALPDGSPDMALHGWAASWLWVALISNDGDAWSKGADALAAAEFGERPDVPRDGAQNVTALEHQAHLVPSMADPADREEMALRYGQMLNACSTCHSVSQDAGAKPAP